MGKKGKEKSKETETINIEAIKMKGGGDSSIPGLGNFEDGEIYLVPDKVSKIDAKNLVDRDVARSVKRPELGKEEAAITEETSEASTEGEGKNHGEE